MSMGSASVVVLSLIQPYVCYTSILRAGQYEFFDIHTNAVYSEFLRTLFLQVKYCLLNIKTDEQAHPEISRQ